MDEHARGVMITRKVLVAGGVYHVTQRAPGREPLFLEEGDYLRFLGLLKETASRFSCEVFCFALMPNHVHLLLRTGKDDLDKAMKFLFQSYAQGFNKKYERKGHVFSGVYRGSLCADDSYLLAASLYIHLNPYKAGLTADPCKYRWTSSEVYVTAEKSSFLRPECILDMVDGRDRARARSAYKALLMESAKLAYDRKPDERMAVRQFRSEVLGWSRRQGEGGLLAGSVAIEPHLELERKIDAFKAEGHARKPETKAAFRYLVQQLHASGYTETEIARRLGVSRATYYRLLRQK